MESAAKRKSPSHADGIKPIQVGCGPKNIFHDWWNVDIRQFAGIDEVNDVTQSWSWKDTLDYVYGEHFLEHLTITQAIDFLVEAGNALHVGGKIRLSNTICGVGFKGALHLCGGSGGNKARSDMNHQSGLQGMGAPVPLRERNARRHAGSARFPGLALF